MDFFCTMNASLAAFLCSIVETMYWQVIKAIYREEGYIKERSNGLRFMNISVRSPVFYIICFPNYVFINQLRLLI